METPPRRMGFYFRVGFSGKVRGVQRRFLSTVHGNQLNLVDFIAEHEFDGVLDAPIAMAPNAMIVANP